MKMLFKKSEVQIELSEQNKNELLEIANTFNKVEFENVY